MDPIYARIIAGEYAEGLAVYLALREPSPEDRRLGAVCLFNLHELQRARDLLLEARADGCEAAGIELATVYRQLGHLDLAFDALMRVGRATLSEFDRALALREHGVQRYTAGDLVGAIEVLERAWAAAHEAAGGRALLPAIGQALGLTYAALGLDRRAVAYLTQALDHAHRARAAQLRGTKALCLAYLGDVDRASADLGAAMADVHLAPVAWPTLEYVAGVLEVVRGHFTEALEHFDEAASRARVAGEVETECYAELCRCAVATALGRTSEAAGFLARARSLAANDKMEALVLLREGALATRRAEPGAVEALATALSSFVRLGLVREQAWACLHLAEAHLAAGHRGDAQFALARATALRHALADGGPMVVELRLLPNVVAALTGMSEDAYVRILKRDLERTAGDAPWRLELRTLGASEIVLDGRRVRLDLRRGLEVLVYLLERPEASLAQILLDLFPNLDSTRGRSYFHQVRYELARAVPGLSVPFDTHSRSYRVRCDGLMIEADVRTVRRALTTGGEAGLIEALSHYHGPFLPQAESEWVETEREDLAWSAVKLGLEIMQDWYDRGDYDKCLALAGRLLEIEPYDEALNEYLVHAARAVEGEAAARHVVDKLARRFERELGVIPPGLARLRQSN